MCVTPNILCDYYIVQITTLHHLLGTICLVYLSKAPSEVPLVPPCLSFDHVLLAQNQHAFDDDSEDDYYKTNNN